MLKRIIAIVVLLAALGCQGTATVCYRGELDVDVAGSWQVDRADFVLPAGASSPEQDPYVPAPRP